VAHGDERRASRLRPAARFALAADRRPRGSLPRGDLVVDLSRDLIHRYPWRADLTRRSFGEGADTGRGQVPPSTPAGARRDRRPRRLRTHGDDARRRAAGHVRAVSTCAVVAGLTLVWLGQVGEGPRDGKDNELADLCHQIRPRASANSSGRESCTMCAAGSRTTQLAFVDIASCAATGMQLSDS
jgi:hypothetical protein